MTIVGRLWEKLVLHFAVRLMEQHRARHPDMAIVSGDYVSLKVMLQGRFEHQELAVLEKEVFPRLKTRNCCLDIGANIGNHRIVF